MNRTDELEQYKQRSDSMKSELFQELSRRYPPLLNQKQYCELTGKADSTAEQDRLYGRGAPFIRMGRSIRYRLDDVTAWLESLPRYNSTTEADNGHGGKHQCQRF
jgi:predicted DNA-binding transcriptional regulator AlpA